MKILSQLYFAQLVKKKLSLVLGVAWSLFVWSKLVCIVHQGGWFVLEGRSSQVWLCKPMLTGGRPLLEVDEKN